MARIVVGISLFIIFCCCHIDGYALARLQRSGLEEQLRGILSTALLPSLHRYLSSDRVASLNVASSSESLLTVSLLRHPLYPTQQVRVRCVLSNVTGTFVQPSSDVNTATLLESDTEATANCGNGTGLLHIESITWNFDFGLDAIDTQTIRWIPRLESVEGVELRSSCETAISPLITDDTTTRLHSKLDDFFSNHVQERKFSVSQIAPIKNPKTSGEMRIALDIQEFTVTEEFVELRGGAVFKSHITSPEWRVGRTHTPSTLGVRPDLEHNGSLVGCALGVAGLNALAESTWYTSWAEVPTSQQQAEQSNLCIPTTNDPCPFPPLTQSSANNTAMHLALSTFFLPSGLFKEFTVYMLAPPPTFQFHENPSSISGSIQIRMFIDGISRWSGKVVRLANITIPVSVSATLPSYNSDTGHFYNLTLREARLGAPEMQFPRQPYANKLATFPFLFAEGPANGQLKDKVLPQANRNIEEALARLPLYIHPLRNVPRPGVSLHFALQGIQTSAVHVSESSDSYLTLQADFTIVASEHEKYGDCQSALDAELSKECAAPTVSSL